MKIVINFAQINSVSEAKPRRIFEHAPYAFASRF